VVYSIVRFVLIVVELFLYIHGQYFRYSLSTNCLIVFIQVLHNSISGFAFYLCSKLKVYPGYLETILDISIINSLDHSVSSFFSFTNIGVINVAIHSYVVNKIPPAKTVLPNLIVLPLHRPFTP
jgi:hypothetical protein